MNRLALGVGLAGTAALVLAAGPALAVVQTFGGPAAGTVIAGDRPDGGTAPGDFFPDFTVSVLNNDAGPAAAIIFDSSNPTGGDTDLGTPNQSCGGPGVGTGGEIGEPGENCTPYGNLLIIADNIDDFVPPYGIVDDPDDEEEGGMIAFDFDMEVVLQNIVIIDVDQGAVQMVEQGATLCVYVEARDLEDNAVESVDLSGTARGSFTRIEIHFTGSAAIAQIEYQPLTVSVQETSWGQTKARFR